MIDVPASKLINGDVRNDTLHRLKNTKLNVAVPKILKHLSKRFSAFSDLVRMPASASVSWVRCPTRNCHREYLPPCRRRAMSWQRCQTPAVTLIRSHDGG